MKLETVKRAVQISNLNISQLQRLHDIENKTKYILPNWNIQDIFGLSDLKYTYNIDPDDCTRYCQQIEKQIVNLGLETMIEHGDHVDYHHSFDWVILNNREKINWNGSGRNGNSGNGLLQRLKKADQDRKVIAGEGEFSLA